MPITMLIAPKSLERITDPMNQYMLTYPVKTDIVMMDLNNIGEAVLHESTHSQQLTS